MCYMSMFSVTKPIPDTLEVTAEVEEKIAKFDEDKRKQRAKKFDNKKDGKNGALPKSAAPPVIHRYPPPHAGIPGMPVHRMPPVPPPPAPIPLPQVNAGISPIRRQIISLS